MSEELNKMLTNLDQENLSNDEREFLIEDAKQKFNNYEGVEFDQTLEKCEDKISSDFDISRKVLTDNIDKVHKLTNMLFEQVAVQPENQFLIGNAINVIGEQNKQIKLLQDLHNKSLINRQLTTKMKKDENEDNGSKLPAGLSFE